jgi:uncharacterized protein with NRDE domain
MCVLTYIHSHNGYILSHNRDETIQRAKALVPAWYKHGNQELFYAKDPKAGGTWMATNGSTSMAIINGAYTKHTPKPYYQRSRGMLIPDFFTKYSTTQLPDKAYFEQYENFTLVILNPNSGPEVLVWDGSQLHYDQKPAVGCYIWSSCTLYSSTIIEKRRLLFDVFLKNNPDITPENVVDFHLNGNVGSTENNLKMQRPDGIFTQCFLQFCKNNSGITSKFLDFTPA